MKIVIATAVYHPMINGVAVFAHSLAVGLAKRGHEVMVICPSQTGKNYTRKVDGVKTVYLRSVQAKVYPDQIHTVPAKKKVLGVELPHLWYQHGFRVSVFPQREVKKVLDKFQPDVVHVQVSDPIGLSVVSYARRKGIPVVTTEHNQPDVITDPLKLPFLVKKPVDAMLTAYFINRQSKSDFVTMPTEKAIKDLIWSRGKGFPVPVAAVSNGVDLSSFKPSRVPARIYDEYKIPKDRPIVLYVGRVDPEKKVGLVIDAFFRMQKSGIRTGRLSTRPFSPLLVIVGDGVDKNRLIKKVEDAGAGDSVLFLGKVLPPDLYSIYNTAEVFVTASPIETQGIVLIEAAATGLPLIAVDAGAVDEVCIDGKNGFLCKPGDIDEMAEAIMKILMNKNLRGRFSENSIKIASKHDFERTLDSFTNIYERVIKEKRHEKRAH